MDAESLKNGFRVGDWLIEPRQSRASAPDRTVALTAEQMQLLLVLAAQHGEAVERRSLRHQVSPGTPLSDDALRDLVASLRGALGDRPRQPRYIATVGNEAYALIAHFELVAPPRAAIAEDGEPAPATAPERRVRSLLAELRQRNVFKVAASYLLGMWIILQVAQVTFAPLRFPDWWMTALTIIAVIGLPIVIVLAWTYEITPQGVMIDPGAAGATVRLPRARQSIAPFVVVGVTLMAIVTGLAWWRSIRTQVDADAAAVAAEEPGRRSIAVLPLVDMSAAGGNAYLGDGLSEELSTRLAQIPGLRVAARTSAFEFKGKSVDVRRIGQSLGVRHVLEGSVRREGDHVRVTVQLIDTRTGFHLWAGNFDRAWRDVLALQEDIARSVTDALQVMLTQDASHGANSVHDSGLDSRAIDPYLAGLAVLRQSGDLSALDRATQYFREVVSIDPNFGRAYAGLCEAGVNRYRRTRDPADLTAAEQSCQQALSVSPGLVESERALAALYVTSGRYVTAVDMYRTLLGRDPRNADTHVGLAQALEGLGRLPEAEASFRQATEAEPSYWAAQNALGGYLFARGRSEEAAVAYRRVAELVPSSASAQNNLGAALFMTGDVSGAIKAYERSLTLEPSRSAYSNLGSTYYYAGRYQDAVAAYSRATTSAPNDQTLWGNLADAQWQIPALRAQAVQSYERAIRLAERDLALSAPDPMLLAQLGYYHCRIGDCARGEQYLHDAVAGGTNQMYVQYFAALMAADRADTEGVERAAAAALRLGYPRALLQLDPVLKGKLGAFAGRT
jgi:TolB-like protein/tetratricopeptide (TPR) repeat protein/DNA-binding winged helix-turn-helix (wHTH) protein